MARRALISVANKTNLIELGKALAHNGFELVSTGGTQKALQAAGLNAISLSSITQHPEILGGRVKTLHPAVFAGLLQRGTTEDHATLAELGYAGIDLVAVNLYPFVEAQRRADITRDELIEEIDIGGVSLLRAAAKNHERVAVCSDPTDYDEVIAALAKGGDIPLGLKQQLAVRALFRTAAYDASIAHALAKEFAVGLSDLRQVAFGYDLAYGLRYGENPHQQASAFIDPLAPSSLLEAAKLQGKSLSYNNLLDIDSALRALNGLRLEPGFCGAVIVKHNTPCGAAIAATQEEAYRLALASDEKSAFGGVVALSSPVDASLAKTLSELFLEVIAAPEFSEEAKAALAAKKNVRLLALPNQQRLRPAALEARALLGGVVVQTPDHAATYESKVVTDRPPTEAELLSLGFAWDVCRSVKSNAIVIAKGNTHEASGRSARTIGISGGQTSRVDAVEMAIRKAGSLSQGAVLASDAFFPFADSVIAAKAAGVTAIIQPGGSVRDAEVIAAANEAGIAMVFTGIRHFRH